MEPFSGTFRKLMAHAENERRSVEGYPEDLLADIIQAVGFSCDRCARCCTRAFNGHVHLLDNDIEQVIGFMPDALEPAFPFDFCDQQGTFYVSGYTTRYQAGEAESWLLLEQGNCQI